MGVGNGCLKIQGLLSLANAVTFAFTRISFVFDGILELLFVRDNCSRGLQICIITYISLSINNFYMDFSALDHIVSS